MDNFAQCKVVHIHRDKLVVKYVLLNYLKDQSEEWDKFILDKDVRFFGTFSSRSSSSSKVVESETRREEQWQSTIT